MLTTRVPWCIVMVTMAVSELPGVSLLLGSSAIMACFFSQKKNCGEEFFRMKILTHGIVCLSGGLHMTFSLNRLTSRPSINGAPFSDTAPIIQIVI